MLDFGFYNLDCMEWMKEFPNNFFDLAIVDPQYGIDINMNAGLKKGQKKKHEQKDWDLSPPDKAYFDGLFRVSKEQIIFGGNYFELPPSRGWIVWDKGNGFKGRSYGEAELAWTSFDRNTKIFQHDPLARGDYKGKIHPCQKPVPLYSWILQNYAKPNYKIIDTHTGSASSLIACHNAGLDFVGFETDKEYYDKAKKRLKQEQAQMIMRFDVTPEPEQISMNL